MVDRSRVKWPLFLTWDGWESIQGNIMTAPSDYNGQPVLNISIPNGLSSAERNRIVNEWCEYIPTMDGIKSAAILGSTNQKLFNSICELSSLEDLRVCRASSNLKSIGPISNLTKLKRLFFDSSSQVTSLSPFETLRNLEWLEVIDFKNVHTLDGLKHLSNLKGLIFCSRDRSKLINLESYAPLEGLKELLYLDVSGTRVSDSDLTPLAGLHKLKYLDIPLHFELKELVKIYINLPNCDHDIGPYRETSGRNSECTRCNTRSMVIPIEKGKRAICKNCDSNKVDKLIRKFENCAKTISTSAPNSTKTG